MNEKIPSISIIDELSEIKKGRIIGMYDDRYPSEWQSVKEDMDRFEKLMNSIVSGVRICKYADGLPILYASEGIEKITGYNKEEIKQLFGDSEISLIYFEDLAYAESEIKRQIDENSAYEVEYRIRRKDGKIIWIRDKGLFASGQGNKKEVQSILTDITEQKEIEEDLRISEKRYEIVMQFSGLTIFEYDIITKQMTHHRSDVEEYKLPRIMNNAVESFIESGIISAESVEDFREIYRKLENGVPYANGIIHAIDATGNENIVEIRLANIFDDKGKPIRAVGVKKNITETLLLQREKKYGNILALDTQMTYEANVSKDKITRYSPQWLKESGFTNTESLSQMIEITGEKIVAPEHRAIFLQQSSRANILDAFNKGKKLISFEYRKKMEDNKYEWVEKAIHIIKDEITEDINTRCYIKNINLRKENERRAWDEQKHYEAMILKSDFVYEVNITKDEFILGCEKWEMLFDIDSTKNYSQMMVEFSLKAVHPDNADEFVSIFSQENILLAYERGERRIIYEYMRLDKMDKFIWVRCTMHLFENPMTGDIKSFAYVEKIDDEKKKELELIYRSQHDLLTGIYNKITLEEKIDAFLSSPEAKKRKHVFFIIDLDYFKAINDNFGHAFGDAVLSQVSAKIKDLFRDEDILGRIGGDEFGILMRNICNERDALTKAQEICDNLIEVYTQNGVDYKVSASIGVAIYARHGDNYNSLYRHSDIALYYAKEHGRNKFSIYRGDMHAMSSKVNGIDQNHMVEIKKFQENIVEYVFRILYESTDKKGAINSVLALIGKYYNASRAYIFEDSEGGLCASSTFEWYSKSVESQQDILKKIPHNYFENYQRYFNDEGIFLMEDIDSATPNIKGVAKSQGIKSMVQFSVLRKGKFSGFIGFDQCEFLRIHTRAELSDMRNVSNILGTFVVEMREIEDNDAKEEMALSIVNGLNSYAYVCDPNTYKVLFINEKALELVPHAKVGDCCYDIFLNNKTPCENCPMTELKKGNNSKFSMEICNDNLDVWVKATASWIIWRNKRKVCLVDSVDISKYIVKPCEGEVDIINAHKRT